MNATAQSTEVKRSTPQKWQWIAAAASLAAIVAWIALVPSLRGYTTLGFIDAFVRIFAGAGVALVIPIALSLFSPGRRASIFVASAWICFAIVFIALMNYRAPPVVIKFSPTVAPTAEDLHLPLDNPIRAAGFERNLASFLLVHCDIGVAPNSALFSAELHDGFEGPELSTDIFVIAMADKRARARPEFNPFVTSGE